MPPEALKLLFDILEAGQRISEFTMDSTFEDYKSNPMLRSAVERQFEIIGEALRHAIEVRPDFRESISESGRIIAFRNRLIHGYAAISDDVVWGVREKNLPILLSEIRHLMDAETK